MREPTPIYELYRWHYDAMQGKRPPVHEDQPHCGWFRRRLVKGGPWVPARIWLAQDINEHGELEADEILRCEVLGEAKDPFDQWVWLASNPISEDEYERLMAHRAEVGWHEDRRDPLFNPRQPINHLTTKLLF